MEIFMRTLVISLGLMSSFLAGCASQPQGLDALRDQASRDAISTVQSGMTLIQQAESLKADALAQETYRFAPALTSAADDSLNEARSKQQKGRGDDEVRRHALAAVATYHKATAHTRTAREVLAPALAHLEVLNSIRAATYYPSDYQAIEQDLNAIIDTLETTAAPASASQTQRQLLEDMHALEVRTIGFVELQQVRDKVSNMDDADARKLIPRSFSTALKTLAAAEDLIAKTPRATAEIAKMKDRANTSADHAQVILSMVNETLKASPETAESMVLRTERWLYNIAVALRYPDIRHLPMDEQSRLLAEGVEELQR